MVKIIIFSILLQYVSISISVANTKTYVCEGSDHISMRFQLRDDERFEIIYQYYPNDIYPNMSEPKKITGTYKEGVNTYDLWFDSLKNEEDINLLFNRSTAGTYIKSTKAFRMNKNVPEGLNKIFLLGCSIKLIPEKILK